MRRIAICFFLASQITITTIILYYFREGKRDRWGLGGNMELEYLGGFYIKPRVEWKGGKLRGVQGRLLFLPFLLYHCISVAQILIALNVDIYPSSIM